MAARQRLNKRLLQDLRLLLSHFVTYVCGPRSFWPNLKTIMAYLTGLLKPVQSIRKKMRNDNENVDDDDDDDDDVTDNVQRWKSKNNTQEAHPHEC